ncbi:Ethyl tert-butyl ether degradation EthD [Macrophomina phaseolina MS6]|uniref:Ethyl tert-butyl ether degradation EthD n=1 Tax=Macrophomina phaseolina (strain MS6) TaxID=1126212 RepID=K2RJH1_MACPH|nr:Ethyl tert-butyl ether degradation EthD [Macrophomina phaseolina MS6]
MPIEVTVLYPNVSDATFNLDYYLKTHMPLVQKEFGPHGLKGWKVAKSVLPPSATRARTQSILLTYSEHRILGTATGEAAPFSIQCTLQYDTKDQFDASLKAAAAPILGDVPNFSNKDPTFLVGDIVGTA